LKNGMSIINLIRSRGYLPTCRVLHLLLWMHSAANDRGTISRDAFVDIGSNIGSCAVHMAALGLPVVAVEPVRQHVDTIQGTININPSFQLELLHGGISSDQKVIKANFGHGARNWGASEFHEVGVNETFEAELILRSLDQVVGSRRSVALVKVDCEGCEWETLKGGRRTLRKTPMMKIELVQPSYTAGNETVHAHEIISFLNKSHFDLFMDPFNEQHLYFGKHGDKIMEIDGLFGSGKFSLGSDTNLLNSAAVKILSMQIDVEKFDHKTFLKQTTDVIAIERSLARKMRRKWLPTAAAGHS